MTSAFRFETQLLDLVTAVVMVPVDALYGLFWLIERACVLLWPYRRDIGLFAVAMAFVALCVAVPALPAGLTIVGVFAYVTMPRAPRAGGWGLATVAA